MHLTLYVYVCEHIISNRVKSTSASEPARLTLESKDCLKSRCPAQSRPNWSPLCLGITSVYRHLSTGIFIKSNSGKMLFIAQDDSEGKKQHGL